MTASTGQDDGLSGPAPEERAGAPALIGAAERQTLAALADLLIPEGTGMPSASQAGVAGPWLDEVLRSRPDLVDDLQRVLARAADHAPAAALEHLQRDEPDDFAILAVVVPGAYYMNPEIRARIGYPGQQAVPIEASEPPDYEEDGLLRSVIERGTIFRS